MNLGKEHIKKILVWILMILWFVPIIQSRFHLITEKKLHGAITKKENPALNPNSWLEGTFQIAKEEYINEEFGFRPFFIRLNNQLEFSLFGKVHAKQVIKGKENYFFEYNYIPAYYGLDFIGEERIEKKLQQLKGIQDTLANHNKTFILIMTASKGQYYPEYFPDSCKNTKSRTNYEVYMRKVKELGINCIDFNSYFLSLKYKTEYPLYSQYGIHWTNYGACLAADSIIHYIEQKRNIDLPELSWDSIKWETGRDDDRDIELGLNLLFSFKEQMLAYPNVRYEAGHENQKPTAMIIADSYYWSLFYLNFFNSFYDTQFWYYYSKIYVPGIEGFITANDSLQKEMGPRGIRLKA